MAVGFFTMRPEGAQVFWHAEKMPTTRLDVVVHALRHDFAMPVRWTGQDARRPKSAGPAATQSELKADR
jgi:hypothetical protein